MFLDLTKNVDRTGRRQDTQDWLDGVDRRHNFGRRFNDQAPDPLQEFDSDDGKPYSWADAPTTGFIA